MYKKTITLILVILMMTITTGCSERDTSPAESAPEEDLSYGDLIFDTGIVHKIDITMSEEDRTDQLADPASKTKYKVDASGTAISDMGSAHEAASGN
jgi:hypothetical protein